MLDGNIIEAAQVWIEALVMYPDYAAHCFQAIVAFLKKQYSSKFNDNSPAYLDTYVLADKVSIIS